MMCERCWGDAYLRSMTRGGSQADAYHEILLTRVTAETVCTAKQQAGQYWNEATLSDSRLSSGDRVVTPLGFKATVTGVSAKYVNVRYDEGSGSAVPTNLFKAEQLRSAHGRDRPE